MRCLTFRLINCFLIMSLVVCAEVSRKPPRSFRAFEKELTDIRALLDAPTPQVTPENSGIILLNEEFDLLLTSGIFSRRTSQLRVVHRAYRALNQAGVELIQTIDHSFDGRDEKIHLVLARVWQPDGRRLDVKGDGAFIREPRTYGDSIYSDLAHLTLVFPEVKPGSVVEYAVVVERARLIIEDEHSDLVLPFSFWPTLRFRHVTQMPEAFAERLRLVKLGSALPVPTQTRVKGGRRWEWTARDLSELRWETDRAPTSQFGPAIWYTTMADWDAFARWYSGLLEPRSRLKPELLKLVEEWTHGLEDPADILRTLLDKVANDVRYVALEFGIGGLQPYDCNLVWKNRYGDCKDKSNLLRVMLESKGIPAWIVLVNTNHAGRVVREAPSYHQFNHAILAAEINGRLVFCDPAASRQAPGVLSDVVMDREVLIIRGDRSEFVRLADDEVGTTRFGADFKVTPGGGLSGWLEMRMSGTTAPGFYEYLNSVDGQVRRERMGWISRQLHDAGRAIDVDFQAVDDPFVESAGVRVYVTVPDRRDERGVHLTFPSIHRLPNLDDEPSRSTQFVWPRRRVESDIRYHLPAGWQPEQLPRPFQVRTPMLDADASWSWADGVLTASWRSIGKIRLVGPGQYPQLFQAVQAGQTWLKSPIRVVPGEGAVAMPPPVTQVEMELMSSGAGQLALVNEMYPKEGDGELRRQALRQVIQWFPKDQATVFEAEVLLASLLEGEEAIAAYRKALSYGRSGIPRELFGWGEHLLAFHLVSTDVGRDEGIAILTRQARDYGLSEFRRGWAYWVAADHLVKTDRVQAEALLREAVLIACEAWEWNLVLLLGMLAENGAPEAELTALLTQAAARFPTEFPDAVRSLHGSLFQKIGARELPPVELLLKALQAVPAASEAAELASGLTAIQEHLGHLSKYDTVQEQLRHLFRVTAPQWYVEDTRGQDDFLALLQRDDLSIPIFLNAKAALLTRFPAVPDEFGDLLHTVCYYADLAYSDDPATKTLLTIARGLPMTDENYYECTFILVDRLIAKEQFDRAETICRDLLAEKKMDDDYRPHTTIKLGIILEMKGSLDAALAVYETFRGTYDSARSFDAFMRAACISVVRGDYDAALGWVAELSKLPEELAPLLLSKVLALEMIDIGKHPDFARAYWAANANWITKWQQLEARWGMSPSNGLLIPEIGDLTEFGRELGALVMRSDQDGIRNMLRQLAYGSRFAPLFASELPVAVVTLPDMNAREKLEIFRLLRDLLTGWSLPAGHSYEKKHLLFLAAIHQELDELDITESFVDTYFANWPEPTTKEDIMMAIFEIKFAAATSRRMAVAADRAVALLGKHDLGENRVSVVFHCIAILDKLDRMEEMTALLELELQQPAIRANANFLRYLTNRLAEARQAGKREERLAYAISRLQTENLLPWYDFIRSGGKVGDRPPLIQLKKVANLPDTDSVDLDIDQLGTSDAAIISSTLHLATQSERPFDERQSALTLAFGGWIGAKMEPTRKRALVDSWLADEQLSEHIRTSILSTHLDHLLEDGRQADFDRYAALPIASKLADQLPRLRRQMALRQFLKLPSEEMVAKVTATLQAGSVDGDSELFGWFLSKIAWNSMHLLLFRSEFDQADALFEQVKGQINDPQRQQRTQRYWNQTVAERREDNPLMAWLLTQFRERLGEPPPVPADLLEREPDVSQFSLNYDEQKALRMHTLFVYPLETDPAEDIYELAQLVGKAPDVADWLLELVAQGMERATGNGGRNTILLMAAAALDLDQPAVIDRLIEIWRPHTHGSSRTAAFALMLEARARLRARAQLPLSVISRITQFPPETRAQFAQLSLQEAMVNNNTETVRQMLDDLGMPWTDTEGLTLLLEAARMVERTPLEMEHLNTTARLHLFRHILGSWSGESTAIPVFMLCFALEEAPLYPPEWFQDIMAFTKDDYLRLRYPLADARLRRDWPAVKAASEAFLARFERHYDLYLPYAEALAELGETELARKQLDIYLTFCSGELEAARARRLLARLEAAATPE